MNGVDFPVARVLDGVDAALEAGLTPVKVNMVVRRGVNEASVVPMARWARETGVVLRFIEYMDVGHSNGWRLDEVVPAQELIDLVSGVWPAEPADPGYRGEVAGRWTLPGRPRRVRHHLVGHPPVLPGLHARSAVGRRQALHVPVRRRGPRRPRGPAGRIERRGAGGVPRRRVACARRPLFRAPLAVHVRPAQGRDVRDGRLRTSTRHSSTGLSTGETGSWTGFGRVPQVRG